MFGINIWEILILKFCSGRRCLHLWKWALWATWSQFHLQRDSSKKDSRIRICDSSSSLWSMSYAVSNSAWQSLCLWSGYKWSIRPCFNGFAKSEGVSNECKHNGTYYFKVPRIRVLIKACLVYIYSLQISTLTQSVNSLYCGGDQSFVLSSTPSSGESNGYSSTVCDYREYKPESQIVRLSVELLAQISSATEPADQDIMSLAEVVFASPASWNASFLLPNGQHIPSTWKNMGVDLAAVSWTS